MTSRTENNNNNKESTMNEEMVVALINSTRESLAAAVFRITELEAELKVEKSKNEPSEYPQVRIVPLCKLPYSIITI